MHESTMFNIITKLPFFKNFIIGKIFNIWRLNVRYRIYAKKRKELINKVFIAKPQFSKNLMEINKLMYDFHNYKTIHIMASKNYETDDFKTAQKSIRNEAAKQYEKICDNIVVVADAVKKQVLESKNLKLPSEMDENKIGKQTRQKPMVQIKKEKLERQQRRDLALRDEGMLGDFIRLVDYMMIENLVAVNNASMSYLLEELHKERKNGLFITSVYFGEDTPEKKTMIYTPPEEEIHSCLDGVLEEMIKTINISRIIEHANYDNLMKNRIKPDIERIIKSSREYRAISEKIHEKISNDFREVRNYVEKEFEECRDVDKFTKEWNLAEYEQQEHKLEEIREFLNRLKEWKINKLRKLSDTSKGIILIEGKKQEKRLTPILERAIEGVKVYLVRIMREKSDKTKKEIYEVEQTLEKRPEKLSEFAQFIENLASIEESQHRLVQDKLDLEFMHNLLKKMDQNPLLPTDHADLSRVQKFVERLPDLIYTAKTYKNEKIDSMKEALKEVDARLERDMDNTFAQINSESLVSHKTSTEDALKELRTIKSHIENYKNRFRAYTQQYRLIHGEKAKENKKLIDLESKFNDRHKIWYNLDKYRKDSAAWLNNDFQTLDVEQIEKDMKKYESDCNVLKVTMAAILKETKDTVLEMLTVEVKEISTKMPIISALGNKDLKPRHWKKIIELLKLQWAPGKVWTLKELLTTDIQNYKDEIEEISGVASGQAQIENSIENIRKKWAELAFVIQKYRDYKDRFIVGSVEDIVAALEEHQMNIQTMLGTRYVHEIRSLVEEWEKKLALISEVIDEWLTCQRQWMYLENIFTAEDIQKQLPAETAKFNQVDKFWRDLMMKANKKPIVQDICASEELLKKLQANNNILEEIQKSLENYLETKRAAFPRFYFLSNDELLEILSQTRNPHAVQNHLRKCFDNINRIKFNISEDEQSKEIIAMISAEPETEPETVPFSKSVMAEGPVEHWLFNIQEMMVTTLYDITKKAYLEYPKNGLERDEWLFSYPAQCVLVVDIIMWTAGCTQAILDVEQGRNKDAIKDFLEFSKQQIGKMIDLVRGQRTIAERTMLGALVVLDVHARDVVDKLIRDNVSSISDFEWTKQLRYYWDKEIDNCILRQTNTRFVYSYEYLGNGPRLVITPLTDKCYMTLTGALHLNYGGAPAGPAGTGKTETTKDLAKAMAVQCIVFNCSDNIDYKTMGRFFSGLAQGGAWACFDEFNRIDIEVLSVIAQQILTIQQAIRSHSDEFMFEGRLIPLNPRFGVFITMNPGYAGRTELPDNLKALFRPVAMMIPDYALIAEIILFSEGFKNAQILARKMVQLYKLSSEQLSKQDHYDFGMRAVKSVLVMAGSLRRAEPDADEDMILIRAMRDSNVPKFLEHDLPLFRGIIQDLFPQVVIKDTDYGSLEVAIRNQLSIAGLQQKNEFITKIIQLMETVKVRHGVMLVGVTGTGKTTVCHTLAKAMGQLNKEGSTDYYHKQVHTYTLNPKSISMNELFGYTNLLTNEWTDGIVAKLVRDAVADKSDAKKWVIFDGPVDAGWIENMNTVLDDNKMLCLPNGERIKLPATFTMMFEVQDLAIASPATVSRCGMVYLEPVHLGWEPILETWAAGFREKNLVKEDVKAKKDKEKEKTAEGGEEEKPKAPELVEPKWLKGFLDKLKMFIKETLVNVRTECKEMIPSVDVNLVKSCLNIIDMMFTLLKEYIREQYGIHGQAPEKDMADYSLLILIFALIWSLGGNIHDSTKNQFSNFLKLKIMSVYTSFPYDGEIYDFYIDFKTKTFKNWSTIVEEFTYDKEKPYFEILVPTPDTVKYKFLLQNLMKNGNNVLISGDTGVGKSVIIQAFLNASDPELFENGSINFSAQTSSHNLMDVFYSKLKKKRKDLYGPPPGKKMLLFIDDINMPQLDRFGAQPPVELLRQVIDQGGFYDLKKLFLTKVIDTQFICACAPPGGGRNHVSPRLFRHFNMFWMPNLSPRSMELIFTSILKGFLSNSPVKDLDRYAPNIVKASVEVYLKITTDLLPTPAKSHYTFNLRDLSKVIQGVLQISYDNLPNEDILCQLWIHETLRVFQDRLVNQEDRAWFAAQIEDKVRTYLDREWTADEFSKYMFGDYTNSAKEYQKIENPEELVSKFNDFLLMHNATYTNKAMNLVFFKDAIDHLSRIIRILRTPRGNALLIGVGGSGRQSLTRLAAYIRGYEATQIELTRNYKEPQFKDDLKKLLKKAGAKNTPTVFIFSDTQIVKETFLEDINNILNTGEVPNLWAREDLEEINNEVRQAAKEAGRPEYQHFVSCVRENLHIVLAFSPVGSKLRERCLQFPSIINCCTIDWYDRWPTEALYSVAEKEYKSQNQLGIGEYVEALSTLSVEIHTDIIEYSEKFYNELKRKNYTTPTSYLELLKLYIEMLKVQQNVLPMKIRKYTIGLQTLNETNEEVGKLQAQIRELQPILEQSAKENAELMIELEKKSKDAAEKEEICKKEAAETQIVADEVQVLRDSCQKDLDEALPILEDAKKAVMAIDKKDIYDLKTYTSPPELVGVVMNAVCLLFYKDKKKETWEDAKRLLGDINFLKNLFDFNTDNIPDRILDRLRTEYLARPNFNEKDVARQSQACTTLMRWVKAIDKYCKVKKIVGPKEKSLKEAEEKLRQVQGELAKKQAALKEVQDTVAALKENLDNSIRKAESLKQKQQLAEIQLGRAEKLLTGLSGESVRWKKKAEDLAQDLHNVTGNIIIAAAIIAYLGPFTYDYRVEIISKWVKRCRELKIPVADEFSIERILADDVTVREWQNAGLPADQLSTENAILINNCRRWPLIIDPQGQANRWIKNLGKDNNMVVTKLTEPTFIRTLENAIRFGQPALLENIEEILDPTLEPILLKQIFKKGAQLMLKLGDQDIPYNPDFKLYITTKLPNPHYLPEVSIKVTLVNFTVTPSGLEDQLLIEVVRYERIELEEQRDQLIVQISEDNRELIQLEDRILKKLAEVAGAILNDEEIINILEASKIKSESINQRMEQAKITSKNINDARENYRVVAKRGSSLYFVIADLALIDPMYQYSLEYFIKLFKKRLDESEHPPTLEERLNVLVDDITKAMYKNICRGLFEKDKLLFSFMIAVKIQMSEELISNKEWNFFLRGPSVETKRDNPKPEFIDANVWKNILSLEDINANFIGLASSYDDHLSSAMWRQIIEMDDPIDIELPGGFEERLTPFQKLLLLKVMREEKLILAIKKYVKNAIGQEFIESPAFDLKGSFQDSTCTTPIIFILSPGADPMSSLLNLAKEKEMDGPRFKILSLGQGQGEIAAEYIRSGRRNGDWVCLQNCHLAATWMNELERIQESMVEAEVHGEYR